MKTTYTLANGKTVEIEVSAELAATLADFIRKDKNEARKYRWRKEVSIEALKEETGWEPTDIAADIETALIADEEKTIAFSGCVAAVGQATAADPFAVLRGKDRIRNRRYTRH